MEYPDCHNNTQANPSDCTGQGVNWDNLIKIETRTNLFPIVSRKGRRSKELCICLLNTQSARNKIEIIRNSNIEHDFDILTWPEDGWL